MSETLLILTASQIRQKLNRMAYQVYEQNFDEKHLIIAGIDKKGYGIASLLCQKLEEISSLKITLLKVRVEKKDPLSKPVEIIPSETSFEDKVIIIVDDVLNTGRTIAYATMPFLEAKARKLQTLVLVQRHHSNFPVMPDFVGMSLATTLQEHISVNLEGDNSGVYLS